MTGVEKNRLNVVNELIGGFFFTIIDPIVDAKNCAITKRSVDNATKEIGRMGQE